VNRTFNATPAERLQQHAWLGGGVYVTAEVQLNSYKEPDWAHINIVQFLRPMIQTHGKKHQYVFS